MRLLRGTTRPLAERQARQSMLRLPPSRSVRNRSRLVAVTCDTVVLDVLHPPHLHSRRTKVETGAPD